MYLSIRVLRAVANANPSMQPFILPVVMLLALFAFTTWIVTPVSNLFLRLNKYGKHLLDKKQVMSSNLVGLCVLIATGGVLMYFITAMSVYISMAIFGLTMMIPLGVAFNEARNRYLLPAYAILLVLLGTAGIVSSYLVDEALNPYMIGYLIGVFIFQWVANYVVIRDSNK
jgi:hypothetical protein